MPFQSDPLRSNGEFVRGVQRLLGSVEQGLGGVPSGVIVIVRDELWQDRIIPGSGERVRFTTFSDFVTAPPLHGLGTTVDHLRDICRHKVEALDAIDRVTHNATGRRKETVYNIHSSGRSSGTTSAAALRRLRKERPDLHAEVVAGRKSPNAAAIEAEHRPKRVSINLGSVASATATIMEHASPEFVDELVDNLCATRSPAFIDNLIAKLRAVLVEAG